MRTDTKVSKIRGRWVARPRLSPTYRPQVDIGDARTMSEAMANERYRGACEQGLHAKLLAKHEGRTAVSESRKATATGETLLAVSRYWTSGRLSKDHPSIKPLAQIRRYAQMLEDWVLPEIGNVAVADVKPSDVATAINKMPSGSSRRHTVNALSRLFALCESPLGLRPEGSSPMIRSVRALAPKSKPVTTTQNVRYLAKKVGGVDNLLNEIAGAFDLTGDE